MNAITMLKADHQKVEALFDRFDATEDHAFAQKQDIAEKVFAELELHATVEEEIFYPAVKFADDDEGEELVQEALAEHARVKRLIDELRAMSPGDVGYTAKFKVLQEDVRHHVEEEEDEMFPCASEEIDAATLEELGRQIAERKVEALHPGVFEKTVESAKHMARKAVSAVSGR